MYYHQGNFVKKMTMKPILQLALFYFLTVSSYAQTTHLGKDKNDGTLSAGTYLLQNQQITLKAAVQLTDLARNKASLLGKNVAVAIVDGSGQTILISRGDGVGVHNMEAARRKAFTAASTKTATLILSRNARSNPDTENLANLPELLLLGGGIPL